MVVLGGRASQRRCNLAISTTEKADLLAVSIGGSWSTQWTWRQIDSGLLDIEVDRIWMETCQERLSVRGGLHLQGATYRDAMKVVILGKWLSLC